MAPRSIPIPEIEQAAIEELGLRRVASDDLTIARIDSDKGCRFIDTRRGRPVNGSQRVRIKALAIPPAWREVRIARDKQAHLQAIGRDDAGRLQYIYHSSWDDVRAVSKAYRLVEFGKALPRLRQAIARDLDPHSPYCPLAAAVQLVDRAYLRAGHEAYAGEESGRGVATLLKRHVRIAGETIELRFLGKGGKRIERQVVDATLAKALMELKEQKGARLFKLVSTGKLRPMTASDLNSYLVARSGRSISTKDFRTFFASARALERLQNCDTPASSARRRRIITAVAREVAAELANTPAIARSSYIHPIIIEEFEGGALVRPKKRRRRRGLSPAESNLLRFVETYVVRYEASNMPLNRSSTNSPKRIAGSREACTV